MSWTKTYFHDAICAMNEGADEHDYLMWHLTGEEENPAQRAGVIFSDRRIDFRGYEEFDCSLCGKPNTVDQCHRECHDEENARADAAAAYFAEKQAWRYLNEVL